MRDSILRQKKDDWLTPVVQYAFGRVNPNTLTWISLVLGLMSVVAIVMQMYWVGLALWFANRIFDGLDGLVARIHDKQSDLGGYLDLVLDFVIYLTVPIAFVYANPTTVNLWAVILLLASYVFNLLSWSTLSTVIEKRRMQTSNRLTSIEMPPGLIEGAETIAFYTLFYLLPNYVEYLFGLMAVLVLFTAGQRIVWAYRNLR